MSNKADTDSAGRKQPSKYLRKKRATTAAKHRWKHKQVLIPGNPQSWSERSYANKLRHMAAARKGGATTGGKIREQQRMFWDFYHGNSKSKLHGPFTAVVETFERIEAAYDQRYKGTGEKLIAWDGYFAEMLHSFVFSPCWTSNSEELERQMWDLYERFMEADDKLLWGDGRDPGLLKKLHEYDDAVEQKKLRLEMWRDKMMSKADKT